NEGKRIMIWDQRLFESGEAVVYESSSLINGESKHFWTSKSPLKSSSGEMIGLIGVSRDITETKTAEDKYRFIFDNAPIAFWEEDFSEVKLYLDNLKANGVTDVEAYFKANPTELDKCVGLIKVLNVNRSTLVMNAENEKEALLTKVHRNFTPESETIFMDEFVALAKGATEFRTEGSFVNNNGEHLEVIFSLNVLPGHEETLSLVLISAVDVTDSKQMASELSNIKHRYQSIVEAQTEMICRLNANGKILFKNMAFSRFFDFKQPDENGKFTTLFPPDELEVCEKKLRSLSAGSPNIVFELYNYDEEGNLVWQEWSVTAFFGSSGILLGYQVVGTDVTSRKMAQDALAASEARWRSVFNYADDLILTLNTDGYILSINEYVGIPKEKRWAGRTIEEVLPSESANRLHDLLHSVVINSSPIKTEIELDLSRNGQRTTFGIALSPITHGKRVISVVCIARDITDMKKLEKQTKEALIEGQEKERMRVSQELHDGLGQLFTAIKLNLQQIRSNIDLSTNQTLSEGFDMLEGNIAVAFNEVRNISRNLMPDVLWQFGLKPAVEDLVDKWNSTSEMKLFLEMVEMDHRFSHDLEKALFRVCQELINNAIRHSKASNIYVQLINHGNSLMLMVEDDGVGFDLDADATGFGLQNIRSRVEVFGGVLDIDSATGQGTVTTIEIPLTHELRA
ncbi:MAG: hypothetical protein RL266_1191, partial [Bacteroidota bacterium]